MKDKKILWSMNVNDRDFTVGTSNNNLVVNENAMDVKTLERCFNERIDREMSSIVDTVEDRIQNAILTAIDNIVAPKIELRIRSKNASSGRDVTSVVANSERGGFVGINASFGNASRNNNILNVSNVNDETPQNIPEEVSELSVPETHFDRQAHTHHNCSLHFSLPTSLSLSLSIYIYLSLSLSLSLSLTVFLSIPVAAPLQSLRSDDTLRKGHPRLIKQRLKLQRQSNVLMNYNCIFYSLIYIYGYVVDLYPPSTHTCNLCRRYVVVTYRHIIFISCKNHVSVTCNSAELILIGTEQTRSNQKIHCIFILILVLFYIIILNSYYVNPPF